MSLIIRLGRTALEFIAAKFRWLFDLIYGGIPAEFESAFDIDQSVSRLSAVTKWFTIATSRRVAEGEVSKDFVSLRKPYSLFAMDLRGGFEPHFKGEFCEVGNRVKLSGRFTLGLFTKAFATIWFGFVLVLIGDTARSSLLADDPRTWWFPFAGLGMFILGVAHVMFCKWCARDDIRWLSNVIEDALSKSSSGRPKPRVG